MKVVEEIGFLKQVGWIEPETMYSGVHSFQYNKYISNLHEIGSNWCYQAVFISACPLGPC